MVPCGLDNLRSREAGFLLQYGIHMGRVLREDGIFPQEALGVLQEYPDELAGFFKKEQKIVPEEQSLLEPDETLFDFPLELKPDILCGYLDLGRNVLAEQNEMVFLYVFPFQGKNVR